MKKCPTCQRTFEDTMRFCQADGTPLVDAAPPVDPYKTMVARPEDIAAGVPPASSDAPAAEPPAKEEEEVLQLPVESDPLKTMYASEEEIRKEMEAHDAKDEPVMDIPPFAPEPPKFSEPSLSPPSFGDVSPPPSPFSPPPSPASSDLPSESPFGKTTPPIPSPFDAKPSTYEPPAPPAPNFPQFQDPEPVSSTASANPFDQPSPAAPQWTPPPAIEPSWQNQEPMQNSPYSPAGSGGGQNQTLAIVSLVLGIVSIVFCQITGPVAVVLGIMARKKAAANPIEYGGAGLGLAGIITGVIGTLLLVLVILYFIFVFGIVGLSVLNN